MKYLVWKGSLKTLFSNIPNVSSPTTIKHKQIDKEVLAVLREAQALVRPRSPRLSLSQTSKSVWQNTRPPNWQEKKRMVAVAEVQPLNLLPQSQPRLNLKDHP